MLYKNNLFTKNLLLILFLSLLFIKITHEDCQTHSFPELRFPKVITLLNGYKLMITIKGIYSFYSNLSTMAYSYNFTSDQIPLDNIDKAKACINLGDISQFSGDENENNYVLIYINNIVYVLTEKGKVLFFQSLSLIEGNYQISLVAYKYDNDIYYFVIGYNNYINYDLCLYYYKMIFTSENEGNIILISKREEGLEYNDYSYYSKSQTLSCNIMRLTSTGKALTCFLGIMEAEQSFVAFSFNPDKSFEIILRSNIKKEPDGQIIEYISSSVNTDKTKSLVCYVLKTSKGKCAYYDINNNSLSDIIIESNYCSYNIISFHSDFFVNINEFVFSCTDGNDTFLMKRFNENFDLIEDNNIYNGVKISNCDNFSFFSIVYLISYKVYSIFINTQCSNDNSDYTKIFMLSNSSCIMPSGIKEEDDEENLFQETEKIKTSIITTEAKIKTSILTTYPKIETTNPKIITTYPKTKTTNPKIIITNIESYTSTQLNIFTEIKLATTDSEENKNTEYVDIPTIQTEEKCKGIGKINYNGKCICDKNNGYYSIPSSTDKCYQKSEIPKNLYYNTNTESYELCYKTCGSCNKSGDYLENNCLTCGLNYIKEKENNSTNCVEKCKFLYFYNNNNQYSCTEDSQCPIEANLIIRSKNKCISKCTNDDINIFQYNGECISVCPNGTEPNKKNICQISNTSICSLSDFTLDLEGNIVQDNVKIVAKNYAEEFHYTENHISKYNSLNFSMILYKNSSCIDELKLDITKIEYNSCIQQLKKDNNISEDKDLIIAIIDIKRGDNPITSFGFFNPDTGEKLDAAKSCSEKSLIMYENVINLLNEPLTIQLLKEQQIDIFNLSNEFYTDVCFHFNSPNGKDATLQDRIKTFYPNITLCDNNCKNKGINMTTMEAMCECTFQDLLSANIFNNELIGNNVLVRESLEEITDMLSNLNLEVLKCYKDIFNFNYFKRNLGGIVIIVLFFFEAICAFFYYLISYKNLKGFIYSLTEKYILTKKIEKKKNNIKKNVKFEKEIKNNPPIKSQKKEGKSNIIKNNNRKMTKGTIKVKFHIKNLKLKTEINKSKKSNNNNYSFNSSNNANLLNKSNNKNEKAIKIYNKNNYKMYRTNKDKPININININKQNIINYINIKRDKRFEINIDEFLKTSYDNMDYDDIIDEDKRTFCQYFASKIKKNQKIINSFFISEFTKSKSIKILIFLLTIDLYFLINGLFYSDSYISEVFNSTEKETTFSFVTRSTYRFTYSTLVGQIISYLMEFFTVDEIYIKKILLKSKNNFVDLKTEIIDILNSIQRKNNILIIINYIIIIFSWYYISCFNNVYPHIKTEWIISSLFIMTAVQILSIIFVFLETCIRFISIKFESEKLFKLSLFFP